jgi:hypothetical protein
MTSVPPATRIRRTSRAARRHTRAVEGCRARSSPPREQAGRYRA